MKNYLFDNFNPLPCRNYDISRYESYIHYVMKKEREKEPSWHCFMVFDDELAEKAYQIINSHQDCECYCQEIEVCESIN